MSKPPAREALWSLYADCWTGTTNGWAVSPPCISNRIRCSSASCRLYRAIVKELCTKQIVGCAFSDRGVQYAASTYRQHLAGPGIQQSMSRNGMPYDNAVAESFFSCLKCECVHLRQFIPRAQAMADIFAYLLRLLPPCAPIP